MAYNNTKGDEKITPEISIQLYSVRDQAAADFEGTIRAIADMGFGNVETAGFPGTTPDAAAKLFASLGIKAPSSHGPLPIGEHRNAILETALMRGHKYLITGVPPKGKASVATADAIKAVAELYCEAAAFASAHGIQVGYHNHDWDLIDVDGQPAYQLFLDNTPDTVLWEADIFWLAKAGIDPAAFLREIGPRGKILHFKDGMIDNMDTTREVATDAGTIQLAPGAAPFLPAGRGQIDFITAAQAADQAEYIVVELDQYAGDMLQALQESYNYVTTNKIASGRRVDLESCPPQPAPLPLGLLHGRLD